MLRERRVTMSLAAIAHHRARRAHLATAILLIASVSGCAVGPRFARPAPPQASRYAAEDLPSATTGADASVGASQKFISGADVPGEWWSVFQSRPLNRIVELSLHSNPD